MALVEGASLTCYETSTPMQKVRDRATAICFHLEALLSREGLSNARFIYAIFICTHVGCLTKMTYKISIQDDMLNLFNTTQGYMGLKPY